MRSIKIIALFTVLLFASCPALNTKPAVAAVGGMEVAFRSNSEAFKKFISNPNLRIDEELRSGILKEISIDSAAFAEMKSAHDAWTNVASSVNVTEVLKRLSAIYQLVQPLEEKEDSK